jgi:hypothetical protein
MFWNLAWSTYLTTWSGEVAGKDTKIITPGNPPIVSYLLNIKRKSGDKELSSYRTVTKDTFMSLNRGDKAYKPFMYSRVIGEKGSRNAAIQLQDLTSLLLVFSFFSLQWYVEIHS